MEYNNSLGRLAFEPFCVDKDNLYRQVNAYSDQLISGHTLYFSGYNNTSGDVVNNESSLFNDLDIDVFNNNSFSLDYLLEDGTTFSQRSSDHLFGGGITTPLGSPISSHSLDDLSYELLEAIDIEEKPSGKNDILSFHDMDTPFSSPNSIHSIDEMSFEFTDLLSTADAVPPLSSTKHVIFNEHMYAKTPESDNEAFDVSSPTSDDSGMSTSCDEISFLPDDFISEQWNTHTSHNSIPLLETKSRDVDFDKNEKMVPSKESLLNAPDDTSNVSHTHRYLPYKAKQKTAVQKLRKKEHNRKSASKYRSKKKEELGTALSDVDMLEERNKELKVTVDELSKEIDYLKSLMLDVVNARLSKRNNLSLIGGVMSASH